MTRHDDSVYLRHMLDYSRKALEMAKGRLRSDLDEDDMLFLALTRAVEIVGEAATKVAEPVRDIHPGIPWVQIIGMRHRLAHGYDAVDKDILWDIIETDLPDLSGVLDEIISE